MEYALVCRKCDAQIRNESPYQCTHCGGTLDCEFDFTDNCQEVKKVVKNAQEFWDYAPFFPVDTHEPITMGEGRTPLVKADRVAEKLDIARVLVKNEATNPTGTFKDRCMSVSLTKARELAAPAVALGSAGNAGAAAAAYAARASIPCYVFLPASTPVERVAQTLMYGARMISVRGTTTDCIDMVGEACKLHGWHNVTTAIPYNPFQAEATKTIAFELAQEMKWDVPDWILVPIGGGGILSGIYKGYHEMHKMGLIDKMPRMVGVQASGCAAVVKAFKEGKEPEKIEIWGTPPTGIAVAIADPYPLDGTTALSAIYESNGYSEMVSDAEILAGQALLAGGEGVFVEPASATTIAALAKLREKGAIKRNEQVVCIATGTGMKDPKLAAKQVQTPPVVNRDMDQLNTLLATFDWHE